jgi:hypothetical protein
MRYTLPAMASPTQHHPLRQNRVVEWENGLLKLIDQRMLPSNFEHLSLDHLLLNSISV